MSKVKLDQINIEKIKAGIIIKDFSEGRTQGRRFKLVIDGIEGSDELIFKDIFRKVEKIARKEKNIHNLETITRLLNELKISEADAALKYDERAQQSISYRINTWIHRFFQWGSHSDRIDDLNKKIKNRLDALQLEFDSLDSITDENEKNKRGFALTEKYLEGNNIDQALLTIPKVPLSRDFLIEKTAYKCELSQAVEIAKNSDFLDPARGQKLLEELAQTCLNAKDLKSAYSAIKDVETFAGLQIHQDIVAEHLKNKAFAEAIEIATHINTKNVKGKLIVDICRSYANEDLANALSSVKSIINDEDQDEILKGLISFYLASHEPGATLEIVQNSDLHFGTRSRLLEYIISKSCEGGDAEDVKKKIISLSAQIKSLDNSTNENKDMLLMELIIHICKNLNQYDLANEINSVLISSDNLKKGLQCQIDLKSF